MQEQNKFRYIYNNEEVSREEFEKLAGDNFKWFDGNSIVSVPFSSFYSFFDGEYRSNRQINNHIKSILDLPTIDCKFTMCGQKNCICCYPTKNTNSTRHKSKEGETHIFKTTTEQREKIELLKQYLLNHPPVQNDINKIIEISLSGTEDELKNMISKEKIKIEGKDDVITNSSRGEKETMEHLKGIKESNGKTDYSEINLEILDLMAERFTANKHKYPKGNMKKPIDIKSLEWALFRHVKKMIQPIETDEETYRDHLSAVLCNCSMLYDQLKVK